jgi:predicted Zn-dependent protease
MSATSEPVGTLETALAHTQRLMTSEPQLAVEQATEILKVAPGHPLATLLLGVAQRRAGDAAASQAILQPLAQSQPNWAAAHYELGLTLGVGRQGESAVAALRRAVALKPEMPDAWRALGDHLTAIGDTTGADEAYARHIKFSTHDPRLLEAAAALCENRIPVADSVLRAHLKQHPTDVPALRMLAEVGARLGRYVDAEAMLERCLELAPSFVAARHNYALVLHRQHKAAAALTQIDRVLETDPRNPGYRNLKAAILIGIGEYEQAIRLWPCAENSRSAGRMRQHVSQEHRAGAAARRGLLEPREPENVSVLGSRDRSDAHTGAALRSE